MQIIEQTINSLEASEWCGKKHYNLIRDINGYVEELGKLKIEGSDFFIPSTYKSAQNKELPCYLVTKKGCEFIAHKMTGIKGTEFTARYINRFHEMEEQLLKENHMDWFVNDVRVFQHREFGILRTLKLDEQDYFVGIDVTRSLGYVNNTDTLKKRVSDSEKCYVGICEGNRCRKMVAITRKGLNELIKTGRLPLANKYSEWIQKQVLPALSGNEVVPVEISLSPLKERDADAKEPVEQSLPGLKTDIDSQKVQNCLIAMKEMIDQHMKRKNSRNKAMLEETLNLFWLELGQRITDLQSSW